MDGLSAVHANDGQHEHENAHAADPVRQASPEEHAAVKRLNRRQNARAGRRKAGDHLEHRVEIKRDLPRERERQRPHERQHDPAQRDGDQALLRVHGAALPAAQAERQRAQHGRTQQHPQKIPAVFLPVNDRHQQRQQHERGLDQKHRAQHIYNDPLIHVPAPLQGYPQAGRALRCTSRRSRCRRARWCPGRWG